MSNTDFSLISISVLVHAPPATAWTVYTEPAHIVNWNFASPDWHCPRSESDLRVGGRMNNRMEAKDGSMGFDFEATYDIVEAERHLGYTFGERRADVHFAAEGDHTRVTVAFVPEGDFPRDLQEAGWQSILQNYKARAESV